MHCSAKHDALATQRRDLERLVSVHTTTINDLKHELSRARLDDGKCCECSHVVFSGSKSFSPFD
jgi:hypothetical protein